MSIKQSGSRSGPTLVGPDLGANCLQRLSADDIVIASRQRVNQIRNTAKEMRQTLKCFLMAFSFRPQKIFIQATENNLLVSHLPNMAHINIPVDSDTVFFNLIVKQTNPNKYLLNPVTTSFH